MKRDSNIISSELYPVVANALDKNSKKFLDNIAKFINSRHKELFDIAPYTRIFFNEPEVEDMFRALGIEEKAVLNIIKNCYFWNMAINPGCIKEPYILVLLCCVRYYLLKKDKKNAELTSIYLAFSGKIYASLHFNYWKYPPKSDSLRKIMDYVINNMLSDKFDLKKEGNVFNAIRKLCITWLNTYEDGIKTCDSDDDWKIYLQQIRDRVKSFLNNIANLYYQAKDERLYLNYETDDLDQDNFRLTDNDAALAARITENAMNMLTSERVSIAICDKCKNDSIKSVDIKSIIEGIVTNPDNHYKLKRVINIIICDFMANNPGKRVGSTDFIAYSVKAKPNTKSEILIEMKATLIKFLEDNSPRFRNINRMGTRNNYYRAILTYFVIVISIASTK